MSHQKKYIVVNKGIPTISQILADCDLDLCFPVYKGESLASILKKLCDGGSGGGVSEETDPIFTSHVASTITNTLISHWNTAYLWGNHAVEGYLKSLAHSHGVANSAGTRQFAYGVENDIRFEAAGSIEITFDPSTRKVIIDSGVSEYGDEQAQDALGSILTDTPSIIFTYDDASNTITADVVTQYIRNLLGAGDGLEYDSLTGIFSVINPLTDEVVQDIVFNSLKGENGVTGTYNDASNIYTVVLGGALNRNTNIDGAFTYDINFVNLRNSFFGGQNYYVYANDTVRFATTTLEYSIDLINGIGLIITAPSGNIQLINGDIQFQAAAGGQIRNISPVYLDIVPHDLTSDNILVQNSIGVISYRTISEIISDYGGVGVTSVGAEIDGSAITISNTPITTTGNLEFNWVGTSGQYVGGDGSLIDIPPVVDPYTDENARDAVGATLTDSVSIDLNYDDALDQITALIKVPFLFDTLRRVEIRFRIDDTDAPIAGATSFTVEDCNGNTVTNKKIQFFRERDLQFPEDDYNYDTGTGVVTMTEAFETGERIILWIEPQELWTTCSTSTPVGVDGALMINDTDHFLINDTDILLF